MTVNTDRIRALNDDLRRHLIGGGVVMTCGVAALGSELVERAVKALSAFDDFHHENDPHEEHDFGMFDVDGHQLMFKIDLYEEPDVKDANGDPVVNRVLTIMLASEY